MESKLKDKLLKLYELAKRGVDGEKINAELMLNRLLDRHDLTIDDIDQELPRKRYYAYTTLAKKKLWLQIINKYTGSDNIYSIRGYKEVMCEVTDFQHVQIIEAMDFHNVHFDKERQRMLKDFTSAYVQKHRLFNEQKDDDSPRKPLTIEERQAILRMMALKDNLSDETYIKKLS